MTTRLVAAVEKNNEKTGRRPCRSGRLDGGAMARVAPVDRERRTERDERGRNGRSTGRRRRGRRSSGNVRRRRGLPGRRGRHESGGDRELLSLAHDEGNRGSAWAVVVGWIGAWIGSKGFGWGLVGDGSKERPSGDGMDPEREDRAGRGRRRDKAPRF